MMIGLAAMPQGYAEGGLNYWKLKEQEDQQAALKLLGSYALNNIPGSLPMLDEPGPGSGGAPPGSMPSGAGPGAGAPTPGTMPPGGVPPRPPMPIPMGGPPAGMMNPLNVAGQPQNMTGPLIPPGGFGGGPGAAGPAPGGPAPGGSPPPGGPPPGAAQMVQRLGPPPPGGYDWRQVVKEIAAANPGADPAIIARSAMMLMPMMNQQAQMEIRALNMQLQGMRLEQGYQRLEQNERNQDLREEQFRERSTLGERREDRMDRAQDYRERAGDENRTIRRERNQTLADQAQQRLGLQERALLQRKDDAVQRAKDRASALDERSTASQRRDALAAWKAAMEDYHRTVRERIGAAGILDKKTREKVDSDLKLREEIDKQDLQEMEERYKGMTGGSSRSPAPAAPGPAPAPTARSPRATWYPDGTVPPPVAGDRATSAEMHDARARLGEGLRAAGKPIPKDKMNDLQALIQQKGRDAVVQELQAMGYDTRGL